MSNTPQKQEARVWVRPEIPDGTPTIYGWVVRHPHQLTLGEFTDIGYGCYLQAEEGLTIGHHAQLGAHCSVYTVSTIDHKRGPVTILPYACVGAGSVVMPGVTIGRGAIVGALSFVNRSIPPWEVWGGNPIHYLKDTEEEES